MVERGGDEDQEVAWRAPVEEEKLSTGDVVVRESVYECLLPLAGRVSLGCLKGPSRCRDACKRYLPR